MVSVILTVIYRRFYSETVIHHFNSFYFCKSQFPLVSSASDPVSTLRAIKLSVITTPALFILPDFAFLFPFLLVDTVNTLLSGNVIPAALIPHDYINIFG